MSTRIRKGFGSWQLVLPLLLCAAAIAVLMHVQRFAAEQSRMQAQLRASEHIAARLTLAGMQVRYGASDGLQALAGVEAALGALRLELLAVPEPQPLSPAAPDIGSTISAASCFNSAKRSGCRSIIVIA